MAERVGNLHEIQGEVVFEWELKDFFPLCEEKKKCFISPKFYFSGTSWECRIYPNGERDEEEGWISLYLARTSSGFPVTVDFTLSIKTVDGKTYHNWNSKEVFNEKYDNWGRAKLISRSNILQKKSQFSATDNIMISYTLKNSERKNVAGSLFSRHQELSDTLQEIYFKSLKKDFVLKLKERNISAHPVILEKRSPVFAAMLNRDTKENQTGVAAIDDVDYSAMNNILLYMYSGDTNKLTTEKVFSLYAAAEKYDVKGVRALCLDFIMGNLSAEWICDVIKFADLYQLQELSDRSREYFKENASKIIKMEKWKIFVKENHGLSIELLGSVVTDFLPEQ